MEKDLIFDYFLIFSGLSREEAIKASPILKVSQEIVESCLKKDVDLNSNRHILSALVAALANYQYSLSVSNADFKIGDVSIKEGDKSDEAKKLYMFYKNQAHELMGNKEIIFRGI